MKRHWRDAYRSGSGTVYVSKAKLKTLRVDLVGKRQEWDKETGGVGWSGVS